MPRDRTTPALSATSRLSSVCACLAAALALPALSSAAADTSYLRPNIFTSADADRVTVQASFTDDFANPKVAVASDQWTIIGPAGAAHEFDRVEAFSQVTILEAALRQPGTYRLSTGERLGRVGHQVKVDSVWKPWTAEDAIPAGVETRTSQTATVADVYVTRGAATHAPVDAPTGRLALKTSTHPSEIRSDAPLTLTVMLDGKAVAGQDVEIWREGGAYDAPAWSRKLRTNETGAIELVFDRPGVYLAWTRLSVDAPAGAQTQMRSHTTSLTFEAKP